MAYRIEGLAPEPFEALFGMSDRELAERNARRVRAESADDYPCRISLEDAAPGEELLLVNHVSNDVPTPFRTAHAIYVRKGAKPARYADRIPDYLDRRTIGLRGFDDEGMLKRAVLAMPGEGDARIRELFEQPDISNIHAHTAALGCFLARIERN